MDNELPEHLVELGLSRAEATAYLSLVEHGPLSASTLATRVGVPRGSVYPLLGSLRDRGLVASGAGYGTRFRALPPEEALPALIDRERASLDRREVIAKELVERLAQISESAREELGDSEIIEVIRNPRVLAERFERMCAAARHSTEAFVKLPVRVAPQRGDPPGPAPGVRAREIWEPAVADDPALRELLARKVRAGDEVRLHDGELPMKFVLFDGVVAFIPLPTPQEAHGMTDVVIRHPALGTTLRMLFDVVWERATPWDGERPS